MCFHASAIAFCLIVSPFRKVTKKEDRNEPLLIWIYFTYIFTLDFRAVISIQIEQKLLKNDKKSMTLKTTEHLSRLMTKQTK